MDRAPLRQVVTRPSGPVDPALAATHVASTLPALDEPAATVLALVEIAGRSSDHSDVIAALASQDAGVVLARARKALRRSLYPLPGSGWCERAERMISDRLDDELRDPGPRRLAVHLDNCPRCVEHERRLAQATDGLVRSFLEEYPEPPLTVVSPEPLAPEPVEPAHVAPAPVEPAPETPQAPAALERKPAPVAAPKPTAAPEKSSLASGVAWTLLFAVAVLLAVATVVITVLGATGTLNL